MGSFTMNGRIDHDGVFFWLKKKKQKKKAEKETVKKIRILQLKRRLHWGRHQS